MARVIGFGELLLRLKSPGHERLLQSPRLEASFGGAEFNVLASLAQLGHSAAYVTALPAHALGRAALDAIRSYGIEPLAMMRSGRMGTYFLEMGIGLRAARVIYDRAGSVFAELTPAEFDWRKSLAGAALLHTSGITAALGESPLRAQEEALQVACSLGLRVSFDLNMRPSLWQGRDTHRAMSGLMEQATILFAGPDDWPHCLGEAEPVSTAPALERFEKFSGAVLERYRKLSAVICCLRFSDSEEQRLTAVCCSRKQGIQRTTERRVRRVVDRIGTGDAFVAAFLHKKLQMCEWQPALEFGLAACMLKHGVPGDINRVDAEEIAAACGDGDGRVIR
jgi:2-dehydro-3-deoxygluconokinase